MIPGRWVSLVVLCWAFCVAAAACSVSSSTSSHSGPALDSGVAVEAAAAPTGPIAEAGPPAYENGDDGGGDAGDATPAPFDATAGLMPAVPCVDAVGDVYVTPPSLPPMAMGSRGDVVRCAMDRVVPVSEMTTDFAAKSVQGLVPTTPTTLYRIAYRTYREDGVPGLSTARVYLPQLPRSLPLPVVAVAHPTEGLAASCTPSQAATSLEDEALPWAAQGFAVIASDYAGLGNGGGAGLHPRQSRSSALHAGLGARPACLVAHGGSRRSRAPRRLQPGRRRGARLAGASSRTSTAPGGR